jgi:hypothetical protein
LSNDEDNDAAFKASIIPAAFSASVMGVVIFLMAARHILPRQENHIVFFCANFRHTRPSKLPLTSAREFVTSISGDEMRPKSVDLRKNLRSPDDASRQELEALKTAKAEQDLSHQKLDRFIADALAELSRDDRAA